MVSSGKSIPKLCFQEWKDIECTWKGIGRYWKGYSDEDYGKAKVSIRQSNEPAKRKDN